jgi:RHS repeat-associated protein
VQVLRWVDDLFAQLQAATARQPTVLARGGKPKAGPSLSGVVPQVIGGYEVSVLPASGATGLDGWLGRYGYALPRTARQVLGAYVRERWRFVAVRLANRRSGELRPLAISFRTRRIVYPMRLAAVGSVPASLELFVNADGVAYPSGVPLGLTFAGLLRPLASSLSSPIRALLPGRYLTVLEARGLSPRLVHGDIVLRTRAVGRRALTSEVGATDGICGFCVLAPSGTSLTETGNSLLTVAGAGIVVDSAGKPALSVTGNGSITAPSVGVVGTVSNTGHGSIQNLTTGIKPVTDPLAGLPAPSVARPASVPSVNVSRGSQTISPGVYQNISVSGQGALTLNPGTYVILGNFSSSGTSRVTGTGITLYLACASYPTRCTSGAKGAGLSLTGNGSFALSGPTNGCLPVTIESDPNNTSTISITGNGSDALTGIIYAPSGAAVLTGNGSTFNLAAHMIVGMATVTGNGNISLAASNLIACTLTLSPSSAGPNLVGTSQELDATLLTTGGSPVSGQKIDFSVTGANPQTGSATTAGSGVAPFTYQGTTVGTDTAQASLTEGASVLQSNTSTITWIKATPQISTTLSASAIKAGDSVTDTATVSGGFHPVGSVSWNVYAASDTGCQTPLNSSPLTASLTSGSATSPSYTPSGPGTFELVATYAGDQHNDSVSTSCRDPTEQVVVSQSVPAQMEPATTTLVKGNFYPAGPSQSTFVAQPGDTPAFSQTFPNIQFDPVQGSIQYTPSPVGPSTRPFTDVTTNEAGLFTGTIQAQGNGAQAGVGNLASFDAEFEANFIVSQPGNITFNITADDGFLLGVGGAATRVSGTYQNPPASGTTPFKDYPLMGAYDQAGVSSPQTFAVTINFPAAGSYPYELDYFERNPSSATQQLSLLLSTAALLPQTQPCGVTGARSLWISNDGSGDAFQTDLTGKVLTDLPNVGISGVGFAGNSLYFGFPSGPVQRRTPDGQQVLDTFSFPSGNPSEDITWDCKRKELWRVGHNDVLTSFDPLTGTVNQTYTLPNVDPGGAITPLGALGITYDSKRDVLYVSFCQTGCARLDKGFVEIVSPDTGAVLGVRFRTESFATGGLAYETDDDTLWVGDLTVVRHMTLDGQVLSSFPRPQPGGFVDGLTFSPQPSATAVNSPVPPAVTLAVTPTSTTDVVGQSQTLTVSATDGAGTPIANLPVTLDLIGPNKQASVICADGKAQPCTTGSDGNAAFSYVGQNAGTDALSATAVITGFRAGSNAVSVTWNIPVPGGGGSGGSPGQAPPAITSASPSDGTVVTKPVPVDATITPPSGQTIASWSVAYQAQAAAQPQTLAAGTGTPPTPLATFDPTALPNDTYALIISATASGGGTQTLTTTVAVLGNLKLGRYVTTYQDLSVPVNGFQMEVRRTYDSYDKRVGDFGIGWHVAVGYFRTSANRELGAGGWTEYSTSCFILTCWAYKTSTPHFVTVTWPDGHQEVFDFTPTGPQVTLIDFAQGTAAFTPRPGTDTTSTLEVANPLDQGFSYGFDGNLYDSSGNIYNPAQFRLTTHDGRVLILDENLGLVSETDRNGNSLTVDQSGIHASNGESILYTRDSQGRITQITSPSGQTLGYSYSASGDLDSSTDADGNTTRYTYDSNRDLLGATGPGGQPLETLTYNSGGRLASITDANGNTTTIADSVSGQQQAIADPNGRLTTITTFDNQGDPVSVDQVFGGKDHTTTFSYDSAGHVISRTDPLGNTYRATYDSAGDITSFTDANGNTTTYAYNSTGQPTSVTPPSASAPQVTMSDDPTTGNLTALQYAGQSPWSYGYGASGALTSMTDPLGHTVSYAYDSNGHLASMTDANGHTTTYTIDPSGLVRSVTDPTGATTAYGYDGAGHLTSVTDAKGHTRTYQYNALGQVATATDPNGHSLTYTYDGVGRVVQVTNRNGQVITLKYDVDGNLLSRTLPGPDATTYTYDPIGELTSASNANVTDTITYNAAGVVASESTTPNTGSSFPQTSISYTYDPNGNRLTMSALAAPTSAPNVTRYSYNSLGRLSSTTDPSGGTTTFGYNALSQVTSITRPNGVKDTLSYDGLGNLNARTATKGSTTISSAGYRYAPNGFRSSSTNAAGQSTYAYDAANRLTSAAHPTAGPASESYSYDAVGNRTSTATQPAGSITYDSGDRMTSDGNFSYAYDNEGDLIAKTNKSTGAVTRYSWNAAHQLLDVHLPNGSTTSYLYDPFGRRIQVDAGGQITRYAYDASNIVYQYDGANNLTASYTSGLGEDTPLETQQAGATYYYVPDGLGSIAALTDASGAVADSYTYDAFGNQSSTGTVPNPFTYTGREYDPSTGLYYYRARYYDPASGRFLSEDPLLAINPYTYAQNNPTNLVDPSGQQVVEYALLLVTPRLKFAEEIQKIEACLAGQLLKIAAVMQNPAVTSDPAYDTSGEAQLVVQSFLENLSIDPMKDYLESQAESRADDLVPGVGAAYDLQQGLQSQPQGFFANLGTALSVAGSIGGAAGAPDVLTGEGKVTDFLGALAGAADTIQSVQEAVDGVCNGKPDFKAIDGLCGG